MNYEALRCGLGAFIYTPTFPNPRLETQQGLFLIGLNPTYPLLYHMGYGGADVAPIPTPSEIETGNQKPLVPEDWPSKKNIEGFEQFKEYFKNRNHEEEPKLWRVGLSSGLCADLREQEVLKRLNVTPANLFPDLAGLAASTDISWGAYRSPKF